MTLLPYFTIPEPKRLEVRVSESALTLSILGAIIFCQNVGFHVHFQMHM